MLDGLTEAVGLFSVDETVLGNTIYAGVGADTVVAAGKTETEYGILVVLRIV